MSIAGIIAGQNLSQNNVDTVLRLLEQRAKMAMANQQASVEMRGQDIQAQSDAQRNALAAAGLDIQRQGLEQTGEYQQGQLGIARSGLELQQKSQELEQMKAADESQRSWAGLGIQQQGVDVQKGDLQLKQAQQLLAEQQRKLIAQAWQSGGSKGAIAAMASMGDVESALKFAETQSKIEKNYASIGKDRLQIEDAQRLEAMSRQAANLNSIQDPEQRAAETVNIARQYGYDGSDKDGAQRYLYTAMNAYQTGVKGLSPEEKSVIFADNPALRPAPSSQVTINNAERDTSEDQYVTDSLKDMRTQAQMSSNRARITRQMFNVAKDIPLEGTTFSELGQKGLEIANALGLVESDKVDPGRVFGALRQQAALSSKPAGMGAMSNQDMDRIDATTPDITWSQAAKQRAADMAEVIAKRDAMAPDFLLKYRRRNKTVAGATEAWELFLNENPVVNDDGSINKGNIGDYAPYLDPDFTGVGTRAETTGRTSELSYKGIPVSQMTPEQAQAALMELQGG